jgi:hypothetical protein
MVGNGLTSGKALNLIPPWKISTAYRVSCTDISPKSIHKYLSGAQEWFQFLVVTQTFC